MSGSQVVDESYHAETCCICGVKFWMPAAIHETALIRCEEFLFWCPNGHKQHYVRQVDGDDPDPGEESDEDEGEKVVRFPVVVGGKA